MYSAPIKPRIKDLIKFGLSDSSIFIISALVVNAGNYFYNVLLGRTVSPEVFAETGLLVTLLLILSFLGMAFQLVTAKYIVEIDSEDKADFQRNLSSVSIVFGGILGLLTFNYAGPLAHFFNLSSSISIKALSLGIPFYFYLSAIRGFAQGEKKFVSLSLSYQSEMLTRFILTFLLIYGLGLSEGLSVALSISASIFVGSMTCGKPIVSLFPTRLKVLRGVAVFFLFTAGYELVQMLTNYFDLILVKHYFSDEMSGLYTALSLIGRMIYFITWMFVMLLIPGVINLKKEGKPYTYLLNRYLIRIGFLISSLTFVCITFPDFIVSSVFGEGYTYIAPFLWKYALATGLLAMGNIFVYYYLSLGNYKPVMIMGFFAVLQMLAIVFFHSGFHQIINWQIVFMGLALLLLAVYHYHHASGEVKSTPVQFQDLDSPD